MTRSMKTSELSGAALDWAAAKCEGRVWELVESFIDYYEEGEMNYSTDWAQGGPIIDRCGIAIAKVKAIKSWHWTAGLSLPSKQPSYGDTPLIAAMRCYVAAKLGDIVEVPQELINHV